jgi:hypothetical protein
MNPETLENIVKTTLEQVAGSSISKKLIAQRCFSPGRPNPTFRFDQIVSMG